MKTGNFPARKLARQIAANERQNGEFSTAAMMLSEGHAVIDQARQIRTKKRRS